MVAFRLMILVVTLATVAGCQDYPVPNGSYESNLLAVADSCQDIVSAGDFEDDLGDELLDIDFDEDGLPASSLLVLRLPATGGVAFPQRRGGALHHPEGLFRPPRIVSL